MPTPTSQKESPLDFPWSEPPEPATGIEVAPGVNWVRMPLPFALDHINLWVLEGADGLVLVDSGFESSLTQEIWARLFDSAFSGKSPQRLICTHHHPDHMGLAGWLMETYGIPLSTTQKEWDAYHLWSRLKPDAVTEMMGQFYKRGGVSGDRQEIDLRRRKDMSSRERISPEGFECIRNADEIDIGGQAWTVNIGTGHSPELAALFRVKDKVLISGDQVLPKISPNVSVMPFALDENPLKDFLESLDRFRQLPSDTLVLPSHKLPFYGLHDRIDSLKAHHMDRLDDALTACRESVTAAQATTVLFPRALTDHQYFFALGETLAHLNYLWHAKNVSREEDADGTFLFERV